MSSDQFKAMMEQYRQSGRDIDALYSDYIALEAAGKTALGLNQWVKSDKPAMEDFNEDNRIIDEKLQELAADIGRVKKKATEFPLALDAGVVQRAGAKCTYSKNVLGMVQVHFCVSAEPFAETMQTQLIAILPPGCRPVARIVSACVGHNSNTSASMPGILHVYPDGKIFAMFLGAKMAAAFGDITFLAEQ